MKNYPDWFDLLFEHTHRQGNIAGVQIIVSFFVLGFAWGDQTTKEAAWVMFFVYFFCAVYIINSLYRIQDRRLTLWRLIALNEITDKEELDDKQSSPRLIDVIAEFINHLISRQDPDENEFRVYYFYPQNSNEKESYKLKMRKRYILKLKPAPKRLVLKLHSIASIFALVIILLSALTK